MRRAPLGRLFSKSMVIKLEPLIKQNMVKLSKNIETFAGTGKPLSLVDSISCFATDVITEYCFGRSYGFLDDPSMQKSLYTAIHGGIASVVPFRHFGLYKKLFLSMPTYVSRVKQKAGIAVELTMYSSVMNWLNPDMELWRVFRMVSPT